MAEGLPPTPPVSEAPVPTVSSTDVGNDSASKKKKLLRERAIPGLHENYKHFLLCILFHFALPLAPIATELVKTGSVSPETLTITATVYMLGIGVSSRDMLIFGLAVAAGIVFAILFGIVAGDTKAALVAVQQAAALGKVSAKIVSTETVPHLKGIVGYSMLLVVMLHGSERWNRHVVDGTPYFEFYRRKEKA